MEQTEKLPDSERYAMTPSAARLAERWNKKKIMLNDNSSTINDILISAFVDFTLSTPSFILDLHIFDAALEIVQCLVHPRDISCICPYGDRHIVADISQV